MTVARCHRVATRAAVACTAIALALSGAAQAESPEAVPATEPAAAGVGSPFSTHHANYLVIGPEDSPVTGNVTSKFQLSLKYDTGANWYFAYTQRGYWDITAESSPLFDLSVEPEVFYFWQLQPEHAERWSLPAVRLGFVHESNGKDGASSRAWSRAYVEPLFRHGGFLFEPKLWAITSTDIENENIADYYGYLDLVIGYETASRQRLTVTGRQGTQHGSVRVDYSLPLQSLIAGSRMRPWLYLQAWAGYGETLLYYDLRTYAFRIGIEFHP